MEEKKMSEEELKSIRERANNLSCQVHVYLHEAVLQLLDEVDRLNKEVARLEEDSRELAIQEWMRH